jgi:sporulation protein YlmC with PRC-barrel domain
MIRTADLHGKRVRSESGERFGRVHEIEVKQGRVETLICGGLGFWQRLTNALTDHRIPWHRVRDIAEEILVAD